MPPLCVYGGGRLRSGAAMAMTESATDRAGNPPGETLPSRSSALALAAALRTALRFHHQMGIENYPSTSQPEPCLKQDRKVPELQKSSRLALPAAVPPPHRAQTEPRTKGGGESQLIALRQDIEACRLCALAAARQGLVAGGAAGSQLLVVGDYSSQDTGFSAAIQFGAAEDAMLWNMMRAIGLTPDDVYVTNAVKCCPLPTELPGVESVQHCREHLLREIELVRPRVICAMGESAVQSVLGGNESVFRLRGRFHRYRVGGDAADAPQVMVTFHPRFLLKNAELKKAAWLDLQMIQRLLQAP
jgi:uracil-DNA glycosylase